jgi:hypothetical protein
MRCANCKKEIIDRTPYGYNRHWIHRHSEQRECNQPDVAIPEKED